MTETNNSDPIKLDDNWRRTWYQEAHSNVQWAKGQGWRGMQLTALVLTAVLAVGREFRDIDGLVLHTIAVIIAVVSWFYLCSLHRFAASARRVGDRIVLKVPGSAVYLPETHERMKKRGERKKGAWQLWTWFLHDHGWLLLVKMAVVLGFLFATFYSVENRDPSTIQDLLGR